MKRRYKICPHCKREIEVEFVKEFGDDFRIEKARADERAKALKEVMPILLSIVDEEGCCYGFENEIDRLEEEYLNLN